MQKYDSKRGGFTIVELLIVIVIIGILAAITIVAFNGVQQRAKVTSAQSDLTSISKHTAIHQTLNDTYPTSHTAWRAILTSAGLPDVIGNATNKQFVICSTATESVVIATTPISNGTTSGQTYYFVKNGKPGTFAFDTSITGTYQLDRLCNQPAALPGASYRQWSNNL